MKTPTPAGMSEFCLDPRVASRVTRIRAVKECAPLFAPGGACADLAKGTRKCTRLNLAKGGAACADFEKAHKDFFDADMKDEMIKK